MSTILIILLNFIRILPSTVVIAVFVCLTVPMEKPKPYIFTAICTGVFLWIMNNYVLAVPSSAVKLVNNLLWIAFTWYFAKPHYRTSAVMCFLVYLYSMFLSTIILSLVASRVAGYWGISFDALTDVHTVAYSVMTLITSCVTCITMYLAYLILKKQVQLENQIRMADEQMKTQINYYRQLQENILRVNQIRHDLSNQLQAAYYLLEQGEQAQVREQLDQLKDNIHNKIGPKYCANLMVDAVLTDKQRICQEQGIHLDVHAQLPSDVPIDSTHLCSAFSNLLDNSIQGVLECGTEEKQIELRTAVQRNCLIIHCLNSAKAPSKKHSSDPLRLHGLGLGILEHFASSYNGSLSTGYHDGKFDTTLILRFPEQAKMP